MGTQGCLTKCFIIEDLGDVAFHEIFERLELRTALTFSTAEAETFIRIKLDKRKHRASKASKHPEKNSDQSQSQSRARSYFEDHQLSSSSIYLTTCNGSS